MTAERYFVLRIEESPGDFIYGLTCCYAPEARKRKCIVVLNGYLDESEGGGTGRGHSYVLAGYVATAPDWIEFSKDWDAVCKEAPSTPDFHMTKAWGMPGPYKWHSVEDRNAKINDLAGVIDKWASYRVDVVLSRPAYEDIVQGRIPPNLDDPYFICFYNAILASCHLLNKLNVEGIVDWIIDKQTPITEDQAVRWYHWVKAHQPMEISKHLGSTPIFRHDSEALPLKAADMYAWTIRRHLDEEQTQGQPANNRLEGLLNKRGVSCHATPEHLVDLVNSGGRRLQANCGFYLGSK